MRFADKVAIITGAASGIGRATAHRFAEEGATVLAVDINADGLAETADGQPAIHTETADISDRDQCQAIVAGAIERFGGVDVLGNIAGVLRMHRISEVTPEDWDLLMGVNVSGTMWMSQAALPSLIERGGAIVNVASNAAFMGQAYTVPYCATKGAVVQLTRAMAIESLKDGVRINAIAPGGTVSNIFTGLDFPDDPDMDLIGRYTPVRGLAEAAQVAAGIAFLASDEAAAFHGAIISADQGMTAG